MCGRLNVIDDPLTKWVGATFGMDFTVKTNTDLRPTQTVATIISNDGYQQLNTHWGITPVWSRHLLINAKAETVQEKKTFAEAFARHRCLVPVSGWYEWRDEGGPRKQKYLFSNPTGDPMLMAGIYYQHSDHAELVTLTTRANQQCAAIHERMPVIVPVADIHYWFDSQPAKLTPLLQSVNGHNITIKAVK